MEEKTLIELLIDAFKENNIEAYPPAIHRGECKSLYVVVKENGSYQIGNFSSEQHLYDILCYVPYNKYTQLSKFKSQVKKIVDDNFYPRLMPTGLETDDFYDENIKAYMTSVEYRNNVRNKHL